MAKKVTVLQFADRLSKLTRKYAENAVKPPFRKHHRKMRKELVTRYSGHPMARKVWEWRKSKAGKGGPVVKYKGVRFSISNRAWVGKLIVSGLAREVEDGGRLRRHVIFGKAVRTPGLVVSRRAALNQVLDPGWDALIEAVASSWGAFVERTL